MDLRVLARAPITYTGADASTQHAPLVAASIEHVETLFVLDTGSDVHILTKELVDRLDLDVEEGEEGVDHSGATMPSWAVEDVSLTLGETGLDLRDVVSIPAPAPFHRLGVGGILSPQHLHPTALTVLDLAVDELLLVDGDDGDAAAWLAKRTPELTMLALERNPGFATVVVPAAVRPYDELPTLLNTGGRRTEFSKKAVPGLGGGRVERLGGGVSGADVIGSSTSTRVIGVAGHDVPVDRLAVREVMQGPQGMVGADVMRGTVLACAADRRRRVFWAVPALERGHGRPGAHGSSTK